MTSVAAFDPAFAEHRFVYDIGYRDRTQEDVDLPAKFFPKVVRNAAALLTGASPRRAEVALQLFRSQAQLDAAQRDIEVLQECGVAYELLSPEALAQAEPALAKVRGKLSGGLRLPNDETGDCHLFTRRLADKARELGVEFRFGQQIRGLVSEGGRISGVRVGDEVLGADHFVLALGSYSREMFAPLGLDLPIYPVKGYSLTIPLVDAAAAPVSTVLDETYKIAITRFDDRIRVGGMAELAGFDLGLNPRRRETLEMVVADQ